MSKCQTCPYSFGGNYDPLSDWCDECTHDPDTGWGGFTDHRVGQHFNNEAERQTYYDLIGKKAHELESWDELLYFCKYTNFFLLFKKKQLFIYRNLTKD